MFKRKNVVDILAFCLPLLFVIFVYNPVFFHPSQYMFDIQGDGVKNYYTLAWFVQNNADWIQHTAMKYPYGEHYLYTDGFVPFGWLFKLLGVKAVSAVGFVNFLMLFSLVLTAFFAHKILQHFKVCPLASVLGGFAIAVLAPQLPRLTGHYALGLSFFFVLSLWLFLKYLKNKTWKWTILILLNSVFWLFIHPYLGIMVVMFYSLVWFYQLVFLRKENTVKSLTHGFVQSIVPLVLFKGFLLLTDIHPLRPEKPWGFWIFNANYKSILLPTKGPFAEWMKNLISLDGVSWESFAYIGLSVMGVLSVYLVRSVLKKEKLGFATDKRWNPFLFSALILLVLSMGIPFIWEPRLADLLSPIRNFRVLGRFAWVFYYIVTLFSVYKLDQWLTNSKRLSQNLQRGILVFVLGLMVFEGVDSQVKMAHKIQENPNYFDVKNLSSEMTTLINEINAEDYLAILPLPFYHLGTYGISPQGDALFSSMIISFHTGLPLFANDLPRTSIVENKKSIMVAAPRIYPKPIFDDIPEDGKVLLLKTKGKLTSEEKEILSRAKELVENEKYAFSEISIDKLKEPDYSKYTEVITTKHPVWKYQTHPDSLQFDHEYNILVDFSKSDLWKAGEYELSVWYKNPHHDRVSATVFLEEKNRETGKVRWLNYSSLAKDVMISGDSIRNQLRFTIDPHKSIYKVIYKNPKLDIPRLEILNWMMRKTDEDIIIDDHQGRSVNNHLRIPFQKLGM